MITYIFFGLLVPVLVYFTAKTAYKRGYNLGKAYGIVETAKQAGIGLTAIMVEEVKELNDIKQTLATYDDIPVHVRRLFKSIISDKEQLVHELNLDIQTIESLSELVEVK